MDLHGIDFTSAPSKRKGITIASGKLEGEAYVLHSLVSLHSFDAFRIWLNRPGPWLGAFDLPFSFPRELIEHLEWPTEWEAMIRQIADMSRAELRETFRKFCDARPIGSKFAHRATDGPAGSSSPMKWVNPPVAYMLHAGVPLLLDAGLTVYTLHEGDPQRIALEAYPGLVARSITRASYKSDDRVKQTPERHAARRHIVQALDAGDYRYGLRLQAGPFREQLIADASGDLLDACLCGILAAWAWQRRDQAFGMPGFDPLEGWIVGA
jgi:hypothetical protein